MSSQQQDSIENWIRGNLWNLIITTVIIVIAFVTVQSKVIALELATKNLEEKIAQYPSQDYFELKFQVLEAGQEDLKQQIITVKQDIRQLQGR